MNNAEKRKKKYLLFPLLFSLLFLLSVSFVFAISASELWLEWGYNNAGTQNRLGDSLSYGDVTNLTEYSQTNYGSNYQPLVNDLDFDGNLDIVVQSGSFLLVYNSTWGLKAQHTVALSGQPTMTSVSDLDNDGFTSYESYIIAHNDSTIFIYDFNGSKLTEIYELNVTADENITLGNNGFKCYYETSGLDSELCIIKYLRYNNETQGFQTNGGFMTLHIPQTCHNTSCITTTFWDFHDLNNSIATIPNFYNLDDSGAKEVIFWSDFDQDGSVGFSVFHATSNSRMFYVDDIIDLSASGLTQTVTDAYGSNNPIMYDLNTGGNGEVYFTKNYLDRAWTVGTNTDGASVYCYDTAGNACTGFPQYVFSYYSPGSPQQNWFRASNLVVNEINGEKVVCTLTSGRATDESRTATIVGCIDKDGDLIYQHNLSSFWGNEQLFVTGSDFNNDDNDDLIMDKYISDIVNEVTLLNYSFDYWVIPIDLDGDVLLDLLGMNDSETQTLLSGGANVGASIDEISTDTGSPSCIGESVAFTITDYTDPEFDAIRLKIDCYGNGTYTGWSLSSFAPEQTCIYTRYGSFQTTFAITDATNYPVITDTLIGTWVVDSGNCFTSGTGGGVAFEGVANATGFNAYHINMTAVNQMTGGDTGLDGYQSRIFDWDGSGCNDWTFLRGVCPAWKWATQGLEDMWDWIFTAFAIFLAFLLVLVIGWFFFMKKERVIPMRV